MMKTGLWVFVSILLIGGTCSSTDSPTNDQGFMQYNSELIAKLEAAIDADIDVCEIDEVVGIPSLINTCQERDRLILNNTDFGPDPDDEASFQELHEARDIAYWKVDYPSLAKIVGLCWHEDGKVQLFRAIVFPP